MVEKKISFFWGNDIMSWLRYMTLWTFRELNPEWKMQLFKAKQTRTEKYWKEENHQDFFRYTGQDYSNQLDQIKGLQILDWDLDSQVDLVGPSHLSNFFKWDLLSNESGVYADMDIVFIKPIDDWYNHVSSGDVAICYHTTQRYFSIGLLGSSGCGDFYGDVYKESIKGFAAQNYQSAGVMALYRMFGKQSGGNHWKVIQNRYSESIFTNFSMQYCYPWDYLRIPEMTRRLHTEAPEITMGLHWYAGHKSSQELNSLLNEKTVKTYDCTIAHFLRKVLQHGRVNLHSH